VDETDEYVDVHKRYASSLEKLLATSCILHLLLSILYTKKMNYVPYRIRVAAAAAASSVARAPSVRRLTAQKASVSVISEF
jgi:hypothetical protein